MVVVQLQPEGLESVELGPISGDDAQLPGASRFSFALTEDL